MPSSSSSTAGIIRCRGWARVPSQAEIATVCPGRTRSRSGGPDTGSRSARRSSAGTSAAAAVCTGVITAASSGSSTVSPSRPYASVTEVTDRRSFPHRHGHRTDAADGHLQLLAGGDGPTPGGAPVNSTSPGFSVMIVEA